MHACIYAQMSGTLTLQVQSVLDDAMIIPGITIAIPVTAPLCPRSVYTPSLMHSLYCSERLGDMVLTTCCTVAVDGFHSLMSLSSLAVTITKGPDSPTRVISRHVMALLWPTHPHTQIREMRIEM